ncbi:hypothetical protein LIER_18307 [Lithospermum erythrorhizon]|uniref:RNA polymerase III subunit C3 n=1 Tax=Lithospermum erythrorhizon TaxID=34254 RepID=A0AAV3QF86_LITER
MTVDTEFNVDIAYDYFDLNLVTSISRYAHLGAVGTLLDRNRRKYLATSLDKCERAVLSLLHHNVVPVTHESGVRRRDVYFLYRMFCGLNGLPAPALAPILIQYMHRSHLFQLPSKNVFNLAQLARRVSPPDSPCSPATPSEPTNNARTWHQWAMHFDQRLDAHKALIKRRLDHHEDLLKQILRKLGNKEDAGGSSIPPSS